MPVDETLIILDMLGHYSVIVFICWGSCIFQHCILETATTEREAYGFQVCVAAQQVGWLGVDQDPGNQNGIISRFLLFQVTLISGKSRIVRMCLQTSRCCSKGGHCCFYLTPQSADGGYYFLSIVGISRNISIKYMQF